MIPNHPSALSRREFITGTIAGAVMTARGLAAPAPALPTTLGPIVGHVGATRAMVWFRPSSGGEYTLELAPVLGGPSRTIRARATEGSDFCLHWNVGELQPASEYRYRILSARRPLADDPAQVITTAPPADSPARVRFAISSCAREDEGSRAVWKRMAAESIEAVVLIGDTPYIDSTDLEIQTRRHREFAAVLEYQHLLRSRACWWTWDDHDFGGNNCTGLLPGKENSRLVYTRYRPQASFGDGRNGIYTSFRYGPVEMFLLDTRWFSMTEPSFARPDLPTLLGAAQWDWLQRGLLASTAPFKLLACGMIWDDKEVRGNHNDSWGGTYMHERRMLERFIAMHRIPGVVLVGGDIHASRVLRYRTQETIGYDLVQFIASPIHGGVIPKNNVFNPDLVRGALEPNVFLLLEANSTVTPARLDATLVNAMGDLVFTYTLNASDLVPR